MNKARDSSFDSYLADALKDPAEAAAYIGAALELDDPAALLVALRHVAKAHGMAEVARRADLGDKTLFRALSEDGNPTLATMQKVLHAVGLRLSVEPRAPDRLPAPSSTERKPGTFIRPARVPRLKGCT